jgi:Protein of unknown function (DUF1360)
MNENNSVWRFTDLVDEEDALSDMILRLRGRIGTGATGRLMDCFYCLSLWIALPMAVFTCNGWLGLLVHGLALSGAASLLERTTSRAASELPRLGISEGDV